MSPTIDKLHPPRRYYSEGQAVADADLLQEGELDGWTYEIEAHGTYFMIKVLDETGAFVAYHS